MLKPDEEAELIERERHEQQSAPLLKEWAERVFCYIAATLVVAIAAYLAFFNGEPGCGMTILVMVAVVLALESTASLSE